MMSLRWFLIILLITGTVAAQETEPSPSPQAPINLSIWWPDTFALGTDNRVHPLLLEQSAVFGGNQENLLIEHRLKAVGTSGGIMSTLRNASNVAPNALPSVTLLRRQDLLIAQREGLIRSLEGGIPSSIQADLSRVLALGQINGELYGLPYLLDLQVLVYRPEDGVAYNDWSYTSVLERGESFVFAGGRSAGVNDVLLLQYLSAGGSLNENGLLDLNADALLNTLSFYQAAVENGMLDAGILNHSSSSSYLSDFQNDVYNMGVFSSSSYLQLYAQDDSLQIAPIPTESGTASSLLNGWLWVVISDEPREQAAALDYIAWMMDSSRQATFAEASFNLPSRPSAMALGLAGDTPVEAIAQLLDNPILALSDTETAILGSNIQNAFATILRGENSAEDASQAVVNQMPQ